MPNSVRSGLLALFFVLGMAFMAAIIALARPDLWSSGPVRIIDAPEKMVFQVKTQPVEIEAAPTEQIVPSEPAPVLDSPVESRPEALQVSPPETVPVAPPPAEPVIVALSPPQPPLPLPVERFVPVAVKVLDRAETGRPLFGRAILVGDPPPEVTLPSDPSCGTLENRPRKTRFYAVGPDHGLADVFVVIRDGLPHQRWLIPAEPLRIVDHNCFFEPYVSAIQAGQHILVENLDPIRHNLRVIPVHGGRNHDWNYVQNPKSPPVKIDLPDAAEFVPFRCDIHPWMFAYVSVVDHPFFAVTGADGRFAMDGLPPGKYKIAATHRKAGTVVQQIEIRDRRAVDVEFRFMPKVEEASAH